MKDPYEVLGVSRNDDIEAIRKTYRKLARQWHPDAHPPEKQAEASEKFKEINAAFEAIENPRRPQGKPFTSTTDDFFSSFFGDRRAQHQTGENIILDCVVTLEEVLNGGTKEFKFFRNEVCKTCSGSGGKQAPCVHCGGAGVKIIHGPMLTVRTSCQACMGTGKMISEKCSDCEDGFTSGKEEVLKFEIPKGVESGMRFAFRNQGHPSKDAMGMPGHIYVSVIVDQHEIFERLDDGNILCNAVVSYTQLVLGDEIEVPTLTGQVSFKIPQGTHPGQRFRLKDLGLPKFSNRTGGIYTNGDQFVNIQLEMPSELDEVYRKAIEELAEVERRKNGRTQK